VQQALAAGAASSLSQDTEPASLPVHVPPTAVPRSRKPTKAPRTPKPSAGKSTEAASAAATDGSTSSGAPTLVELVIADLAGHSEPRSASEITAALTHAHPDRKMQTTVVRNALEALVAKGLSQRSKQGRSVFYSATQTADTVRTTDGDQTALATV
jgi:Penicillinase repressor